MDLQLQPHQAVDHPDSFVTNGKKALGHFTDRFATWLSGVYGKPATIWAFIGYSLVGAFVTVDILNKMLYWSNTVQLVFCAVSTYVGVKILKRQQAQDKANHKALTHIANVVDTIADHVLADCDDCLALGQEPLPPISNPNYDRARLEQMADDFDTSRAVNYTTGAPTVATISISSHSGSNNSPIEC